MHTRKSTGLLFAALLSAGAAGAKDATLRPWPAGQATPALRVTSQDGQPWDLAGLRGTVVVVNFWASWCGPCVDELPVLKGLASHQGVAVVGVNYKEPLDTIERFTKDHPLGYPVLRDRTGDAFRRWTPGVMPTTILVDRSGRARWRTVGEIPPDDTKLRAAIDALLTESQRRTHKTCACGWSPAA
jgi:cytochrome c biogenesis protein CcmG/thiol:disulfide interchange protein DsbE